MISESKIKIIKESAWQAIGHSDPHYIYNVLCDVLVEYAELANDYDDVMEIIDKMPVDLADLLDCE